MDLFLNLWYILKKSLIYIFVRYLSYSLLWMQRKFKSGYILCDNTTNFSVRHVLMLADSFKKYVESCHEVKS